jgi:hypothetical protein
VFETVCASSLAMCAYQIGEIWWQSSKTFQKVNYVTCSLVLWKYRFGVICTKMLQIQRKIC